MRVLFTILLVATVSFTTIAQNQTENHPTLISVKPLPLFFGLNAGIETPLSSKFSLKTEVNSHFYYDYKNIAVSPTLKWYFNDEVSNGFHLNLKTFGGYFFDETVFDDKPYYIGGGVGIGWISPQYKDNRLRFFAEINLKYPHLFGNRVNSTNPEKDGAYKILYMYYLSPASVIESNLGFAFRL